MKLEEFISKLELAYKEPSFYQSGGWGKWIGTKWGWDCVCLIKGILWGWNNDKTKPRGGGAVYESNGVPDCTTEQLIAKCDKVSKDFGKIEVGELVWMQGHVGIYVGNGNVIEATVGWNTNKVIKSQIDNKGTRTYNGIGGSPAWLKHGFLPYVDYSTTETEKAPEKPKNDTTKDTFKVGDKVVPTKLVNYTGTPLKQYDKEYIIIELNGDRAVLSAKRGDKMEVWAAMNIENIEKI